MLHAVHCNRFPGTAGRQSRVDAAMTAGLVKALRPHAGPEFHQSGPKAALRKPGRCPDCLVAVSGEPAGNDDLVLCRRIVGFFGLLNCQGTHTCPGPNQNGKHCCRARQEDAESRGRSALCPAPMDGGSNGQLDQSQRNGTGQIRGAERGNSDQYPEIPGCSLFRCLWLEVRNTLRRRPLGPVIGLSDPFDPPLGMDAVVVVRAPGSH